MRARFAPLENIASRRDFSARKYYDRGKLNPIVPPVRKLSVVRKGLRLFDATSCVTQSLGSTECARKSVVTVIPIAQAANAVYPQEVMAAQSFRSPAALPSSIAVAAISAQRRGESSSPAVHSAAAAFRTTTSRAAPSSPAIIRRIRAALS